MSKHAKRSASSAHRWMNCAGSIAMSEGEPNTSSAAAEAGTEAHAYLDLALRDDDELCKHVERYDSGVGFTFGYEDHGRQQVGIVDPEMNEAVDVALERVVEITKAFGEVINISSELRVNLEHIRPDMFGTADIVILGKVKKSGPTRLVVIDYKHGFTPVRLVEDNVVNPQLMFYGAAALEYFKEYNIDEVQLEVIQPRCFEVDSVQTEVYPADFVRKWSENELWEAAVATEAPDAPLKAGGWCRFCPALHKCPEALRESSALAKTDFAGVEEPRPVRPETLTVRQLSQILCRAPIFDAWLRQCEAHAASLIARGTDVPGFKLVRKKTNRRFPDELTGNPRKLAKALGVPVTALYGEPELRSPAQMEKVSKAVKEAVARISVKPEGEATLAAESDRREALAPGGDFKEVEL